MYKNIHGTTKNICDNCGSWKNHWIKQSCCDWPDKCQVLGCKKEAEVGAHVKSVDSNEWYILPMCYEHNNNDKIEFSIKSSAMLISANVEKTCGKKK